MDDDDFFEHFRNKDLSKVRKFNFKKAKGPQFPGDSSKSIVEDESNAKSGTKIHFDACERKENGSRKKAVGSSFPATRPNNCFKMDNRDNILDSLYKSAGRNDGSPLKISSSGNNKYSTAVNTKPEKSQKHSLSLKTKISLKTATLDGSPSLLSGRSNITSKGTFNISKYFNSKSKDGCSKTNNLSPVETNSLHCDKKQEILNSGNVIQESNFTSTVCDSVTEIKPKKFIFKKKPVNFTSPLNPDKNNDFEPEHILGENLVPMKEPSCSSDDKYNALSRTECSVNCANNDTIKKSNSRCNNDSTQPRTELKRKKFVFKKKPLKVSSSSALDPEKNDFDLDNILGKHSVSLNELSSEKTIKNLGVNNNAPANQNEVTTMTKGEKNEVDDYLFNDVEGVNKIKGIVNNLFSNNSQLVSSTQLQITDGDYMDDEEFERRFGSLADQFDDTDLNDSIDVTSISKVGCAFSIFGIMLILIIQ